MDPFRPKALAVATTMASLLAWRARKKKSLSKSGALAGFTVGFLLVNTGLRGMTLFAFYQIGSMATKYKKDIKAKKDATVADSSVRGAGQVLAVSIIAVGLSLYHAWRCGPEKPIDIKNETLSSQISLAVLAHHACCLADTLASELGILSNAQPILVTRPWTRVPAGTNGGITVTGTLWSIVGGGAMGLFNVTMDSISGIASQPLMTIAYGSLCGFLGSMFDSIFGATIQASYYDSDSKLIRHDESKGAKHVAGLNILSNEQVNFVSAILTTAVGGFLIGPMLFK